MKKLILLLLSVILVSCQDKKDDWLTRYQETKCLWQKTEMRFGYDTLQASEKVFLAIKQVQTKLVEVEAPYKVKIATLKKQIEAVKQKYHTEYRRISDAHSKIHGHISTPEYEKNVLKVNKLCDDEVAALQNQIRNLQQELGGNSTYKVLTSKIAELRNEIGTNTTAIKQAKYQSIFDSLQVVIVNQNLHFKSILVELKEPEKQNFIQRRDSIRANPCNH